MPPAKSTPSRRREKTWSVMAGKFSTPPGGPGTVMLTKQGQACDPSVLKLSPAEISVISTSQFVQRFDDLTQSNMDLTGEDSEQDRDADMAARAPTTKKITKNRLYKRMSSRETTVRY